jgi:hypothetical protein
MTWRPPTMTLSATTDGATRLTAATIRASSPVLPSDLASALSAGAPARTGLIVLVAQDSHMVQGQSAEPVLMTAPSTSAFVRIGCRSQTQA